jgi:hypothetical protein
MDIQRFARIRPEAEYYIRMDNKAMLRQDHSESRYLVSYEIIKVDSCLLTGKGELASGAQIENGISRVIYHVVSRGAEVGLILKDNN